MTKKKNQELKNIIPEFHNREEEYDIIIEVNKIQEKREIYKMEEIKQMHNQFATDNPELFEKCCKEKLSTTDKKYIVFLLETRRKVKNNLITYQEANQIVSVFFAQEIQPELLQKDGFKKKK